MPVKREPKPKNAPVFDVPKEGLYVYAEFEGLKPGDKFIIPPGWVRDEAYEQLIFTKNKPRAGMVFVTPKERRVTVPVMEA